jgi:1,4-dihydroxy-2-naphthoyl-CoA hydrolase
MPTLEELNDILSQSLPGLLGITITWTQEKKASGELPVRPDLLAPNGYLHAGSVITLADTVCGMGTIMNLPDGAQAFTTIELKANFLGTAREGKITCDATLMHGGRTTQVWDARVSDDSTKQTIALFRCTQMILYPSG